MKIKDWSLQLGQVLDCKVEQFTIDIQAFTTNEQSDEPSNNYFAQPIKVGQYYQKSKDTYLVLEIEDSNVTLIMFYEKQLTLSEQQLIRMLTKPEFEEDEQSYKGTPHHEMQAIKLGKWLQAQIEAKNHNASIPDELLVSRQLYNEMIPILLVTDSQSAKSSTYQELDKLIKSFLSNDVIVVPINNGEWIIFGPASLLRDDEFADEEEQDSIETILANLAYGLQELLANEWIWESHLAISYPVIPAKQIVAKVQMLRETIQIGRRFHEGTNIHLLWDLQLERLLHAIPDVEREKYLEQSLKRADLFVEAEMMFTLETFFSLDCNVSETAKKLYIHRNTLLYRLDKLKQETGLDVRLFRDAVLVKIILLLYKVTKTH